MKSTARKLPPLPELPKQQASSVGQQPLFGELCQLCGRDDVSHFNARTVYGLRDVCTRCLRKYSEKRRSV